MQKKKLFVNIYNKKPKEKNPLEGTQWGGHSIVKNFKKLKTNFPPWEGHNWLAT